jgi:hypothetical protein
MQRRASEAGGLPRFTSQPPVRRIRSVGIRDARHHRERPRLRAVPCTERVEANLARPPRSLNDRSATVRMRVVQSARTASSVPITAPSGVQAGAVCGGARVLAGGVTARDAHLSAVEWGEHPLLAGEAPTFGEWLRAGWAALERAARRRSTRPARVCETSRPGRSGTTPRSDAGPSRPTAPEERRSGSLGAGRVTLTNGPAGP